MKKILLIDDDLTFLKVMNDTLVNAGYTVVQAQNGEEGLVAVEKNDPDLILLDMVMPKMGGIEFLKNLKQKEGGKQIPILVVSSFSGANKIEQGMEFGIRGYIVKSDESLKTIISNVELIIGKAE